MKTKKLIALTMLTLFVLLIVPMASNTTASNTWIPLLSNQVNTTPKAITTEPLGTYVQDGDNLTYDVLSAYASITGGNIYSEMYQFAFEFSYNYTATGDWFLVNITVSGHSNGYFAIHNQTREVGLNSTGGLFPTPPASEDEIYRQNNVYAFIALPTGIKAGDNIKILAPYSIEVIIPEVVPSEVMGRITAPTFNQTGGPSSFYDSWMTQGTWRGTITLGPYTFRCAMGLNNLAERHSGLSVTSTIAESLIFEEGLYSVHLFLQFNSTASTPNIIPHLEDVNITGYTTGEYWIQHDRSNFTYSEAGYWYMDVSELTGGKLGIVRLDSLNRSYFNWTLGPMNMTSGFIPAEFGISQEVRIPDDFWNTFPPWNSTYYNSTTRTGWRDIYFNGTAEGNGLVNLLRFCSMGDGFLNVAPANLLCLASPWIRDGTVMTLLVWLPLFFPNNTKPGFNFDPSKPDNPLLFLAPFKVSGAATVNIGGSYYDCWKADLILPQGLSNFNITQFSYTVYFERTTGMLLKAKADIEMKIPINESVFVPMGYHKTWTLSDVDGDGIPLPREWIELANEYRLGNVGAGEKKTLDSSFFNGGSATIECNITVPNLFMHTYTLDWNNYTSINGYPIVKLMYTRVYMGIPTPHYEFNLTLNFYYTPSELSAKGAKELGFTICYYNTSSGEWVPLNTTVDSDGRIVSASITVESSSEEFEGVFALVAGPLTIWDILGPIGSVLLLNYIGQAVSPSISGFLILGLGAALIAVLAIALVIIARRH
ncbi:MAG: hypothetical protein ACUVXA_09080 [Candidatus Jordarchaeum sp.]|uniref:hypothetical protein n=1 Tax=Candidatus Jordarchaeum sp. TaxID=2823881 RepID=UPI00404A92BD